MWLGETSGRYKVRGRWDHLNMSKCIYKSLYTLSQHYLVPVGDYRRGDAAVLTQGEGNRWTRGALVSR